MQSNVMMGLAAGFYSFRARFNLQNLNVPKQIFCTVCIVYLLFRKLLSVFREFLVYPVVSADLPGIYRWASFYKAFVSIVLSRQTISHSRMQGSIAPEKFP